MVYTLAPVYLAWHEESTAILPHFTSPIKVVLTYALTRITNICDNHHQYNAPPVMSSPTIPDGLAGTCCTTKPKKRSRGNAQGGHSIGKRKCHLPTSDCNSLFSKMLLPRNITNELRCHETNLGAMRT